MSALESNPEVHRPNTTTWQLTHSVCLVGLTTLALSLWMRDLAWVDNWEDALPAMLALPAAFWLGRPWQLATQPKTLKDPLIRRLLIAGAVLFTAGAATHWVLMGAIGWTCLLASFLAAVIERHDALDWRRLLPLAVLGFPWILEAHAIGWWFRWSGAATCESLLTMMQLDIMREGTQLWTNDTCVSVSEACSGLRGLQAILVAGSVLAVQTLSRCRSQLFWLHLPLLLLAAWAANTARVIATALAANWLPLTWVQGDSHYWQGWLLLCLAFCLCQWTFHRMASQPQAFAIPANGGRDA